MNNINDKEGEKKEEEKKEEEKKEEEKKEEEKRCATCNKILYNKDETIDKFENKNHKDRSNCMITCLTCSLCMVTCLNCNRYLCVKCLDTKSKFCIYCLRHAIDKTKKGYVTEEGNYTLCLSCDSILHLDYNDIPCYNNPTHTKGCESCMKPCYKCSKRKFCIDCSHNNNNSCGKCLLSSTKINYIRADLFSSSKSLVHCVSECLLMRAGIADQFRLKFGRVLELKRQRKKVGDFAYLEVDGREIYYLITKRFYNLKPTLMTLESSLIKLRDHMEKKGVYTLSMPKIGCGLDKLDWEDVEMKIEGVFFGREKQWEINVFEL